MTVTIYEHIWTEWEGQAGRHSKPESAVFRQCAKQLQQAHRQDMAGAEEWRQRHERLLFNLERRPDIAALDDDQLATYLQDLSIETACLKDLEEQVEARKIAVENLQARRKY